MKRALHIALVITAVSLSLGALICGACMGRISRPDTVCTTLVYQIQDSQKRLYVSENELNTLLRSQDAYPLGKPLSQVSLQRMEDVVRANPMVRNAECYLDPRGNLYISVEQRKPLLRVITADDSYVIDSDRLRMPVRSTIQDTMLVVIGKVGPQMARTSIADFAVWLQNNPYWRTRIKYLEVKSPHYIRLLPKNPNAEIIVLGDLKGYQDKLHRLRIFYENAPQTVANKHYKELDLRFEEQVVGRK